MTLAARAFIEAYVLTTSTSADAGHNQNARIAPIGVTRATRPQFTFIIQGSTGDEGVSGGGATEMRKATFLGWGDKRLLVSARPSPVDRAGKRKSEVCIHTWCPRSGLPDLRYVQLAQIFDPGQRFLAKCQHFGAALSTAA